MTTSEVSSDNTNRAANVLVFLVLGLPAILWRAWVVMRVYDWFAPPSWGRPGFAAFVGVCLMGIVAVPQNIRLDSTPLPLNLPWAIVTMVLGPAMVLVFAFLLSMVLAR